MAAGIDGLLAGASLDQSIKQLPARQRTGVRAFFAYSQAADLGNGIISGTQRWVSVAHCSPSPRPVRRWRSALRPPSVGRPRAPDSNWPLS